MTSSMLRFPFLTLAFIELAHKLNQSLRQWLAENSVEVLIPRRLEARCG